MTAHERWRADRARYYVYLPKPESRLRRLKTLLFTEALWSIGLYRFGQFLLEEAPRPLRWMLVPPFNLAQLVLGLVTGIHLFPQTQAGAGLYVGHYGGIWISPLAVLGERCSLSQGVTLGIGGRNRRGAPRLGDRVWIGPNATISGPVRVGSGAVVAANSLVVAHVPDNAVVIGVPARVLSYTGSAHLLGPSPLTEARAGDP